MRLAPLIALIAPALALARSGGGSNSQNQIQVFLHPSPSSPHSTHDGAPTLSPEQAKAVLKHHMGEAIGDFEEIPADEGMWGHLIGMWGGKGRGEEVKGRVVIVDGGVSAQEVLPTSLGREPSFYLPADADADSLLAPYLAQATSFLQDVMDNLPAYVKDFVDDFEMAGTKAAAALQKELSALIALSEKRLTPFLANLKHSAYEAVRISGLGEIAEGSRERLQGSKTVRAGIESMTQPDSPPLLIIIRPSAQTHFHAPQRRQQLSPLAKNDAPKCYATKDACEDGTECSGRGQCSVLGKNADGECWGCKCQNGYAGGECQKTDYTVPFAILVFSSLFLVVLVIGSISLLWSVGETKLPSTLTLAVGGGHKRD